MPRPHKLSRPIESLVLPMVLLRLLCAAHRPRLHLLHHRQQLRPIPVDYESHTTTPGRQTKHSARHHHLARLRHLQTHLRQLKHAIPSKRRQPLRSIAEKNTPDPSLMTRAGRVDTIDVIDAIELTTSDPLPLGALPDRFVKPSPYNR